MCLEFKYHLNDYYITLLIWNTIFVASGEGKTLSSLLTKQNFPTLREICLYRIILQKNIQIQLLYLAVPEFYQKHKELKKKLK